MKPRQGISLLMLALALTAPGMARAADSGSRKATAGKSQPVHIQANKAIFNRKERSSTYIGAVKVDQGRLHLRGERLEVTQIEGPGSNFIGVMTGDPATLMQEPARSGQSPTYSHAQKIIYNSKTRILHLKGNAFVRQGGNTLTGQTVTYNLRTRRVTATRSEGEQVHITLYPDKPPSGFKGLSKPREDGQ